VVVYELLTGERLFKGEDASDTLAQVLTKQPDLKRVPANARRLLQECLQKDPKLRLRDIGYAKRLLGDEADAVERGRGRLPWAIAGALALIAVIAPLITWRATRSAETPPQPIVRVDLDLDADAMNAGSGSGYVVLSPDGNRLVYGSQGRFFTRRLDQPEATDLSGTAGALYEPFFSPDGKWLAFAAQGKLKKIQVEGGGPAVTLSDAGILVGGSWGEDGNIIAALNPLFSQVGQRVEARRKTS
jgi:eukaryotic-like serine/threonine-protein kinase